MGSRILAVRRGAGRCAPTWFLLLVCAEIAIADSQLGQHGQYVASVPDDFRCSTDVEVQVSHPAKLPVLDDVEFAKVVGLVRVAMDFDCPSAKSISIVASSPNHSDKKRYQMSQASSWALTAKEDVHRPRPVVRADSNATRTRPATGRRATSSRTMVVENTGAGTVYPGVAARGYDHPSQIEKKTGELEAEKAMNVRTLESVFGATFAEGTTNANEGVNTTPFPNPSHINDQMFNSRVARGGFGEEEIMPVLYVEDIDEDGLLYRAGVRKGNIIRYAQLNPDDRQWLYGYRSLGGMLDQLKKRHSSQSITIQINIPKDGWHGANTLIPVTFSLAEFEETAEPQPFVTRFENLVPKHSVAKSVDIRYPDHRSAVIWQMMTEQSFARLYLRKPSETQILQDQIDLFLTPIVTAYEAVCAGELSGRGKLFRYTKTRFVGEDWIPGVSRTTYYERYEAKPILVDAELFPYFEKHFYGTEVKALALSKHRELIGDQDIVAFWFETLADIERFEIATQSFLRSNGCNRVGRALIDGLIAYYTGNLFDPTSGAYPTRIKSNGTRISIDVVFFPSNKAYPIEIGDQVDYFAVNFLGPDVAPDALSGFSLTASFYTGLTLWRQTYDKPTELKNAATAAFNSKTLGLSCRYQGKYDMKVYLFENRINVSDASRSTLAEYGVGPPRSYCPLRF